MTISQRELILKFIRGQGYGEASNLFIIGDTLYGCNKSYPLLKRLSSDENMLEFLLNSELGEAAYNRNEGCKPKSYYLATRLRNETYHVAHNFPHDEASITLWSAPHCQVDKIAEQIKHRIAESIRSMSFPVSTSIAGPYGKKIAINNLRVHIEKYMRSMRRFPEEVTAHSLLETLKSIKQFKKSIAHYKLEGDCPDIIAMINRGINTPLSHEWKSSQGQLEAQLITEWEMLQAIRQ